MCMVAVSDIGIPTDSFAAARSARMTGILAREPRAKPPGEMTENWLHPGNIGPRRRRSGWRAAARRARCANSTHPPPRPRPGRDRRAAAEGGIATPADLTGVMVGRGPGSYTGLRVGIMSAKALAYATGCQLLAVDTFAAIAEQAPAEAQSVVGDRRRAAGAGLRAAVHARCRRDGAPRRTADRKPSRTGCSGRARANWISGPA